MILSEVEQLSDVYCSQCAVDRPSSLALYGNIRTGCCSQRPPSLKVAVDHHLARRVVTSWRSRNRLSLAFLLGAALSYSVLMTFAQAATFDCKRASSFAEKVICSDSRLASMDDQLGRLYKNALSASSDSEGLKAEQKAWLSLRNQCKDSDCIMKAYTDRISAL